jgi:methionyl aminopeptidase
MCKADARHQSAKSLLKSLQKNFGTLPFCRRSLDKAGEKNYLLAVSPLSGPANV